MILYTSTRTKGKQYSFLEAVLKGIAQDGGLFLPVVIPELSYSKIKSLLGRSYQERAISMFTLFDTGLSEKVIMNIVDKAYANNFDNERITPVIHLKDNQYILELWHGPTSAFKDLALQIMPLFFSEAVKNQTKLINRLILVATSGDTGKAALEGYKNREHVSIMVFYPNGHTSKLQELQMTSQEGDNVSVCAINGDFDAVQTLVKQVFNDTNFDKDLLANNKVILSSANSINWGRLLPQIAYHIDSYLELVDQQAIQLGSEIDIVIPTGNFGNILAAFYAKKMGLPIRKLICASNSNNVLTEFLQTGVYDISSRKLVQTPSPSMDILIASNIERLLYIMTDNPEQVSIWMDELKQNGKFEVDHATKAILKSQFYADWVSNEACLDNIAKVHQETEYLMDPHTSVAQLVAQRYIKLEAVTLPIIINSTAHWAKFAKDIYQSLKTKEWQPTKDEFTMLKTISKYTKSPIPRNLSGLQNKSVIHRNVIAAKILAVEDRIKAFLKGSN